MVSVKANTPEEAAKALLEHNFAIVSLPEQMLAVTRSVYETAPGFFTLDQSEKKKLKADGILAEGWLPHGSDLDKVTLRPDLHATFKAFARNLENQEIESLASGFPFYASMRAALPQYLKFACNLLLALRAEVSPKINKAPGPMFDINGSTYFQFNYSHPSNEDRATISEPHEDGDIFTIIKPSGPGLAIEPGYLVEEPSDANPVGRFAHTGNLQPVEVGENEAIIVPSVPTYYMTGGRIKPLFHAVNRVPSLQERMSLVLFVNATNDGFPLAPWIKTAANKGVDDVHEVVNAIDQDHIIRHDNI